MALTFITLSIVGIIQSRLDNAAIVLFYSCPFLRVFKNNSYNTPSVDYAFHTNNVKIQDGYFHSFVNVQLIN